MARTRRDRKVLCEKVVQPSYLRKSTYNRTAASASLQHRASDREISLTLAQACRISAELLNLATRVRAMADQAILSLPAPTNRVTPLGGSLTRQSEPRVSHLSLPQQRLPPLRGDPVADSLPVFAGGGSHEEEF